MPPTPPLPAPMSPLAKAAIGCAAALLVLGVAAAGLLRVRQLMRRMRQMRAEKERLEFEFAIAQHAMANGVQMHTPLSEFANTGADSRSVFHDSVFDYQCQGGLPSSGPPLVWEGSSATPATTTTTVTTAVEGMGEHGGPTVRASPPPIRSDLSPTPPGASSTPHGVSAGGGAGGDRGRSRPKPRVITHSIASLSAQGLSETLLRRARSSDGSGSTASSALNPASEAPSEGACSEDGASGRSSCIWSRSAQAEASWMSRTTWRRLDEALDALPAGLLVRGDASSATDVDRDPPVPAAVATHPQPISSSRVPQTSASRASSKTPSSISSGASEGSTSSELANIFGR